MSTPPAHKPLIRSNGLDEFSGLVLSGFEVKKNKKNTGKLKLHCKHCAILYISNVSNTYKVIFLRP